MKLIILDFPKFTDGRAYTQARLLRERLGYTGELRASGAVFIDQLPFLLRCGFDSFASAQKGFGEALAKARTLVQRRLSADRRRPRHGQRAAPQAPQRRRGVA